MSDGSIQPRRCLFLPPELCLRISDLIVLLAATKKEVTLRPKFLILVTFNRINSNCQLLYEFLISNAKKILLRKLYRMPLSLSLRL